MLETKLVKCIIKFSPMILTNYNKLNGNNECILAKYFPNQAFSMNKMNTLSDQFHLKLDIYKLALF
ncbi:hypothetical protein BpHYR1_005533 [Brachionus plicatilis]|uniref:Uncharacterized protein n=1 Tax=Brachionus plicatilis TaxID=10195 RepID=A0A3M7Q8M1_BRAPC|nr:hypothetical protein BpHYR1_005533 [Brachionus plicatilis]